MKAASGASKKYNLTRDQVTAEVCQKYLRERMIQAKQKNVIKREEQIVELYEEFKRRKWLFTISLFYKSLTSANALNRNKTIHCLHTGVFSLNADKK